MAFFLLLAACACQSWLHFIAGNYYGAITTWLLGRVFRFCRICLRLWLFRIAICFWFLRRISRACWLCLRFWLLRINWSFFSLIIVSRGWISFFRFCRPVIVDSAIFFWRGRIRWLIWNAIVIRWSRRWLRISGSWWGEQLKVFLEFMGLMEFQELLEPMEIVVELTEFLELLEPMVLMAFLLGLKGYFGI